MIGLLGLSKAHSSSQQGREAAAGSTEGERPTGRGSEVRDSEQGAAVTRREMVMAASHSPAVSGEPVRSALPLAPP